LDAVEVGPVPLALVAVIVNVYAVPLVSPVTDDVVTGGFPVTVRGGCAVVPMNGVIVYEEIPLPPFAGAVHVTVAEALPAVAVTPVGAAGTVAGVTAAEAVDVAPVPTAFVAVTRNVYAVPFVSPVIVVVVTGGFPVIVVAVCAVVPMNGVIVYEVIPLPLPAGAIHDTVAEVLPAVAVTPVGAPGTVAGVTEFDAVDPALVPTTLVAVTLNVYAVPLVSPVTDRVVAGGFPFTPATVRAVCAVVPTNGVIVYRVMTLPPLDGAVQFTVADALPAAAVTAAGTPGAVIASVTVFDCVDAAPVPMALVAATRNV